MFVVVILSGILLLFNNLCQVMGSKKEKATVMILLSWWVRSCICLPRLRLQSIGSNLYIYDRAMYNFCFQSCCLQFVNILADTSQTVESHCLFFIFLHYPVLIALLFLAGILIKKFLLPHSFFFFLLLLNCKLYCISFFFFIFSLQFLT